LASKREQIIFPWYVELPFKRDYDGEISVCYWRKCWGIRSMILGVLHSRDKDEYEYPIEEDDIPAIIRGLEQFLDKEYWDENASSIWEYEEYKPHLISQVKNLLWLREYLVEHPGVKCYFYDSY
jgi:hypothetical protein